MEKPTLKIVGVAALVVGAAVLLWYFLRERETTKAEELKDAAKAVEADKLTVKASIDGKYVEAQIPYYLQNPAHTG